MTSENNQNQQNAQQSKQRKLVIGSSTNKRSNIAAAGVITKKRVYCLVNVNADCTVEDIKQHISTLSFRLYTGHHVKPRQRRYNDEQTVSRTAFRVCIAADDKDRLPDTAVWPDSIIVADWYFKPRDRQEVNRQLAPVDSDLEITSTHPRLQQQQSDVYKNTDMKVCDNDNGDSDNVNETTVLYRHGATSDDS